ncbi:MAG: hypothetical protein Q9222_005580 [Ikaeria aurantiellina]
MSTSTATDSIAPSRHPPKLNILVTPPSNDSTKPFVPSDKRIDKIRCPRKPPDPNFNPFNLYNPHDLPMQPSRPRPKPKYPRRISKNMWLRMEDEYWAKKGMGKRKLTPRDRKRIKRQEKERARARQCEEKRLKLARVDARTPLLPLGWKDRLGAWVKAGLKRLGERVDSGVGLPSFRQCQEGGGRKRRRRRRSKYIRLRMNFNKKAL